MKREILVVLSKCLCIRYVKECTVYERFLGFVHITDLSATGLATVIINTLNECG